MYWDYVSFVRMEYIDNIIMNILWFSLMVRRDRKGINSTSRMKALHHPTKSHPKTNFIFYDYLVSQVSKKKILNWGYVWFVRMEYIDNGIMNISLFSLIFRRDRKWLNSTSRKKALSIHHPTRYLEILYFLYYNTFFL